MTGVLDRLRSGLHEAHQVAAGDRSARLAVIERFAGWLLPDYALPEWDRRFMSDDEFRAWYDPGRRRRSSRTLDRKYALDQLVKLALPVAGDTAECGVFEGKTSELICRRTQGAGRTHHAFDSFAGLSQPCPADGSFWRGGWYAAPEELVRARLGPFRATVWPGWIPDRFAEVADRKFSFVHIDVDLYEPTLASMEFFYPRLSPGGLLVCDDFGSILCPGAYQAVQEFMADHDEEVIALPSGQALVQRRFDSTVVEP